MKSTTTAALTGVTVLVLTGTGVGVAAALNQTDPTPHHPAVTATTQPGSGAERPAEQPQRHHATVPTATSTRSTGAVTYRFERDQWSGQHHLTTARTRTAAPGPARTSGPTHHADSHHGDLAHHGDDAGGHGCDH